MSYESLLLERERKFDKYCELKKKGKVVITVRFKREREKFLVIREKVCAPWFKKLFGYPLNLRDGIPRKCGFYPEDVIAFDLITDEEILTCNNERIRSLFYGKRIFALKELCERLDPGNDHLSGNYFRVVRRELRSIRYSLALLRETFRLCPTGTTSMIKARMKKAANEIADRVQLREHCEALEKALKEFQLALHQSAVKIKDEFVLEKEREEDEGNNVSSL